MATAPAQNENPDPSERRVNMRRARGGASFSRGVSTRTESLRHRDDGTDDTVDDDLNERVLARLPAPASQEREPVEPDDPLGNRRILAEAAMAGDANYAKEFRLSLLHKLLVRGISLDNIARELGVSISTVQKDRVELRKRLRQTAQSLDINELIGGQLAFYDDTVALSMRLASQQNMPTAMRLASLRTALAGKADQTRFLTSAGVFDVLQFRKSADGGEVSDVQMLMQQTDELLQQLIRGEESGDPSEPRPASKVVRRSRSGFSAMTFDDKNASGSDQEVQEL